jgi:excisionase family DNA binding protein
MTIPEEFYEEGMLTIAEAAALARVSVRKLYFEISDGRLRTQYLGRKRLVARGELLRFLRELPEGENLYASESSRRAQAARR